MIVEEGVTVIDDGAFEGCTGLVSVTLPSTLTTLGTSASAYGNVFKDCTSLTTVNLKDTAVTALKGRTFLSCTSLTEIELPEGLTTFGAFEFTGTSIESITIPASVTALGSSLFGATGDIVCDKIKTVTFAEGSALTSISRSAFESSSLESITLPEGLTTIGEMAFKGSAIKNITIPASVKTVNYQAFMNCANLTTVTFAEGSALTTLGHSSFKNSAITAISLPATLSTMSCDTVSYGDDDTADAQETGVFTNCYALTSVVFERNEAGTLALTRIGSFAFQNAALTSITIPETITYIGESAFDGCKKLTDIVFDAVEKGVNKALTISTRAFADTGIQSIVLPDGVSSLPAGDANINGDGAKHPANAFDGVKLKQITFPANASFRSTSSTSPSNTSYCALANMTSLERVIIPEGITTIYAYSFAGCTSIKELVIPASVTTIQKFAFDGWTSEQTIKMTGKLGVYSAWVVDWNAGCNADIVWNYTAPNSLI